MWTGAQKGFSRDERVEYGDIEVILGYDMGRECGVNRRK